MGSLWLDNMVVIYVFILLLLIFKIYGKIVLLCNIIMEFLIYRGKKCWVSNLDVINEEIWNINWCSENYDNWVCNWI